MKIRTTYVSNSSSSSYIVFKDLTSLGIPCMKLNTEQVKKILDYIKADPYYIVDIPDNYYNKDIYLTTYISDCRDGLYDILRKEVGIMYDEGELNEEPRAEEYYNQYPTNIVEESWWIRKEHDNNKQMKLKELIKYLQDSELPKEFIVEHTSDGINLKYTGWIFR